MIKDLAYCACPENRICDERVAAADNVNGNTHCLTLVAFLSILLAAVSSNYTPTHGQRDTKTAWMARQSFRIFPLSNSVLAGTSVTSEVDASLHSPLPT